MEIFQELSLFVGRNSVLILLRFIPRRNRTRCLLVSWRAIVFLFSPLLSLVLLRRAVERKGFECSVNFLSDREAVKEYKGSIPNFPISQVDLLQNVCPIQYRSEHFC